MHGIINPFCIVLYAQRMNRMGGLLQSQKGLPLLEDTTIVKHKKT